MVPTGFRFNPTDEELIEILQQKAFGFRQQMPLEFIVEINVYGHEPQDLQWNHTAAINNNERYYFCKKDNDSREVSGRGWWKATSHVKKIFYNGNVVGYKRPLTFHKFKNNCRDRNDAIKTNWIMHEYSLESKSMEWRLCKIRYKGKPSLQEEIEIIRNDHRPQAEAGTSSSSLVMQPYCSPNLYFEASSTDECQDDQQPQPSHDSCHLPFTSTSYSFGEEELNAQEFPCIWSWQN